MMTDNVERVVARGEALEDLEERSELLQHSTVTFRNSSTKLKRKVMWKSVKLWVGVTVFLLIALAVIATLIVLGVMGKFSKK